MARPTLIPHQVGNKILQLPDEYSAIGTVCGVTKINGAPAAGSESISVSQAVEHGLVRRATVRLNKTNKIRSVVMLAANSPQVGALVTLAIGGDTVKSAYFSQRIELG